MSEHLSLTIPPPEEDVVFDLKGVARGARLILPIALGVATYGLVFGIRAQQANQPLLCESEMGWTGTDRVKS